jgi:phenylalanyl-tRNA synthetase beta chain
MKVPLKWLEEFVSVDATVEQIARRVTVAGLEVENLERVRASFSGVVVARVLDVGKHPNADRLSLCQVDAGAAGRFSVVCGAPNVSRGMTAALATVGAKLGDEPELEAAVIRGIRSEGMLCSERELGLSQDHHGILSLPDDAPLGTPVADYLGLDDVVLDIAILANRGDALSILGVARDVAALFGVRLHAPRTRPLRVERHEGDGASSSFAVRMAAPEQCPRYAALKMTGVRVAPSPVWMRRRLELCGMRGLNNVVDATNYVMLEMGQPLHAFDLDRIAANTIVVRRAGSDREFVTLDNARRALEAGDLVIADPEKPLALAGVMGGLNSEVGLSTQTILLESAYFEPIAVAKTARRLGLRSEASYRFERGIDRAGQTAALMRVAELLKRYADARPEGAIADFEPRPAPVREIALDLNRMSALLGVETSAAEAKRRLVSLGASVRRGEARGTLKVIPPSWRSDLDEAADLAEEVARLSGLEEIPATLPARVFSYAPANREREFFRDTREVMLGAGFTEIDTLAFISAADNEKFAGIGHGEPLSVHNPLSEELREMRRSLAPGLLAALIFNLNRQATALHAFEIAKVFARVKGEVVERYHLGALSYGDYALSEIGRPGVKAGFFTLKGVAEAYLRALGVAERVRFKAPAPEHPLAFLHPGRSALILLSEEPIGYVGEFHPQDAMERGLAEQCTLCELDLQKLISYGLSPRPAIEPPPRFPAVRRDLALVLDREFPADMILKTIREIAPALLESVEVFDVYEGEAIAPGRKSVALALRYRATDRTLTDEEVNRTHAGLVEQARTRLGAELRQ